MFVPAVVSFDGNANYDSLLDQHREFVSYAYR